MEASPEQDKLESLIYTISARVSLAHDLVHRVNFPEKYRRSNIIFIEQYKKDIENVINEYLNFEPAKEDEKNEGKWVPRILREKLISLGYMFDIHPSATYISDYFRGEALFYLGRITEKHTQKWDSNACTFLITRTFDPDRHLSPYPLYFQPDETQVYTVDDTTWIDHRSEITSGEYPFFHLHKTLKHLKEIELKKLIEIGEKNYLELGKFKLPRIN